MKFLKQKKRLLIFLGTAVLLFLMICSGLTMLYFSHKNFELFTLEQLRVCPFKSKVLVVVNIIKNKIIFSYYWDDVRRELLKKNPELKLPDDVVSIDYLGFMITLDNNMSINDLTPINRVPLLGQIYIYETVKFPYSLLNRDYPNVEIYYRENGESKALPSSAVDAARKIWHQRYVEIRLL